LESLDYRSPNAYAYDDVDIPAQLRTLHWKLKIE